MAEEHVAEAVDVDRGERRQRAHPVETRLIEHACSPVGARRPDVVGVDPRGAGVEAQPRLDQLALAVAADRDRAVVQRAHGVDGLAGERPSRDVTADDDQIDVESLDLRQHRDQRSVVAMDVVERRDPHDPAV